jgi:ubiquinone/menaquinone biosynthesis C-methylase UbiE
MPVKQSNEFPSWGDSYRLIASEKWKAKSAAMGRDVTQALVEYAQPEPGMKVLDLASGTGEPGISIASFIGPHGHITLLDLSSDLLQIAEERALARGLANFSLREHDANQLPFPDRSFDLITSRFGVMFFGEQALREAFRVLKPGARACFLAWGPFEQPYWSATMGIVHRTVGGDLLPAGQDPFKYGQRGSLSAALQRAGFRAEEESRNVAWNWPGTAEELWEQAQAVATPFRPMLQRATAEQRTRIDAEVLAALQPYLDDEGLKFRAAVVLASGAKI